MQNILVVAPEGHSSSTASVCISLERAGYAVCPAHSDGKEAEMMMLSAFSGRPPDVLITDLSVAVDCLMVRHFRRLIHRLWGEDAPLPIFLSLCCTTHLLQPDFLAFTDDFLLPPYTEQELIARLRLLLFRRRLIDHTHSIVFGDSTLDLDGRHLYDASGSPLTLRPREYDLFHFLATHRGKFFSRGRLLDLVWGLEFEGSERTVDIHVRRLRVKLPPLTAASLETRRGVGYGLLSPSNSTDRPPSR